jgi:hypothetical protein
MADEDVLAGVDRVPVGDLDVGAVAGPQVRGEHALPVNPQNEVPRADQAVFDEGDVGLSRFPPDGRDRRE